MAWRKQLMASPWRQRSRLGWRLGGIMAAAA
jgi:hypothetical protein